MRFCFFYLKLKRLSVTAAKHTTCKDIPAVNNNGDMLILMVLMLLIHVI